jgi:intron-binding protein aquarius
MKVRGCEVYGMTDEEGVELNDPLKPDTRKQGRKGDTRTIKIKLDSAQYHHDMKHGVDVYSSSVLNVLVRRHGKENNFKAVLETIRDLMNSASVGKAVPSWLHDLFLGYGDPAAAHYKSLQAQEDQEEEGEDDEEEEGDGMNGGGKVRTMDFRDTFLNVEHVKESFPDAQVEVVGDAVTPPFKLSFMKKSSSSNGKEDNVVKEVVRVEGYTAPNPGPYPQDQPKVCVYLV